MKTESHGRVPHWAAALAAGALALACLVIIQAANRRLYASNPKLGESVSRGSGMIWEGRRALALVCWGEAQDYFHRGFHVADYVRPEDLAEFNEHEKAELAGMRESLMGKPSAPPKGKNEAGNAERRLGSQEDKHEHDEHEELERRFGLDTHPLMNRSLLRPYVLEHEHGVAGVPMMIPWYWLTTALDPHFTRAFANGSWWLAFVRRDVARALDYLDKGLFENPKNPDLLVARGEILFRLKNNLDAAAADFRLAALNAQPPQEQHETALRLLGLVLEHAGRRDEACRVAREGLRLYPGHVVFPTLAERNCPKP